MLPSDFAVQLAPMIGTSTIDELSSLNGLNLSDSDRAAMAIAMTQGLQEVFALGPPALSEQRYSTILRGPTNVTFNATQFSTTISSFATWASWMEGCTIQGGDGEDNELLSATELLRPYNAATGAVSATVYGDAIKLPSWAKNTMPPVETQQVPQLVPANNREEFRWWNAVNQWGHYARYGWPSYSTRSKSSGRPLVYFVEPRYDPSTGALPLFMRFNPMPGSATPVTFRIKRKPPVIVANDLSVDNGSLTVTGTLTPDATGVYPPIGDGLSGTTWYVKSATVPFQIRYEPGDAWYLSNVFTTPGLWVGPAAAVDGPAGTYTPFVGGTTGTATVTLNGSTDLVVPTDWHESILLPIVKKWFMAHPAFQNPALAAVIMDQYRTARAELESFAPQISAVQGNYY